MTEREATCSVRVLASFYLTGESGKVSEKPAHKDKFNISLASEHRALHMFKNHLLTFTALEEIAKGKGLGENPDVNIVRVQQKVGGAVERFFIPWRRHA